MDAVPISGLPELQAHLHALVGDAALPIQAQLLDQVELQLTETNIPPLLTTLLPPLTQILKATSQDPTPLLSLTVKLLTPLSFAQTLAIADAPSLLTALRSPLPGANLLALAVVHKAAAAPADAAILSTLPEVVEELVRRWLESPDVGVGERAAKVLGDVLETDCDVVGSNGVSSVAGNELVKRSVPGHARLWRLILQTRPHLSLIQSSCTPNHHPSRSTHAVTISQGRVLRLLPRLAALNIRVLSQSAFPDLFPLPDATAQRVGRGLLQWAALGMVTKSDVLMHLSLIDFFEAFVSVMRVADHSTERHDLVKSLVRTAVRDDPDLHTALRSLPDRTVEEEAEALRRYVADVLG
ncbi:uncharacterized protein HRG_08981 [Hirsutella rhossiliensis]|uniref:DNA mismatch repair protein HSM3 N-terminal domain-containing protein n=1 Tax=Hirsutella rhossiliensis TaxID=111463 RepID=A0A9P8SG07_9HYPO|nr:uncharacterized protein HRG_08981 [Hirsutella rhossiliensis]KAH0959960.1 hypothetical protein HRG_08981 [Hirsutella rhossiliensis]